MLSQKKNHYSGLFLVVLLVLQGCSIAPKKPSAEFQDQYRYTKEYLDWMIPRQMKVNQVVGASVLILDDDKIVYRGDFGYANADTKEKVTPTTAFRIGSITKMFTATAILQLQEQGKLNIDDPLTKYLTEFQMNSSYSLEGITLRRMLSHISGLPSDYEKGFFNYQANETFMADLSQEYVSYAPEVVFSYSNLAYNLLGRVIERVSGQSYEAYVKTHLFQPMQMTDAFLGNSTELALGHDQGKVQPFREIRDVAAGDMAMPSKDLAKFARVMLGNGEPALKPATLQKMFEPQGKDLVFASDIEVGLGWILTYPKSELRSIPELIWHNGSTGNFNAILVADRTDKLAVVVLTNSSSGGEILYPVAQKAMALAIKSKTGEQYNAPSGPTSRPVSSFTAQQRQQLTGLYVSNRFGDISVSEKGKSLYAKVAGNKVKLILMDDGSIGIDYRFLGLIPVHSEAIKSIRLRTKTYKDNTIVSLNERSVIAQKVVESELSEGWSSRLGRYQQQSPEPELDLDKIVLKPFHGLLKFNAVMDNEPFTIYLKPASNDRAVIIGYGRGEGGSVVFHEDKSFYYKGFTFTPD